MTQYGFGSIPQILTSNGAGIIPSFQSLTQPGVMNLGIAQTSGTTFTVQGANGTALSASNPAYVTLQSLANPGQLKTYKVIANQSFTQAQLGNNLFGLTTAVNATVDIPFYLYGISNANNGENAVSFFITRIPILTIAPIAANIAQSGNTNATTQGSVYSLATITAADYASSPSLCIGSFRMQYSSSLWTIQTLNNGDGIGQFNDSRFFNPPLGQFGTATNSLFYANGGTAPIFSVNNAVYTISRNGLLSYTCAAANCTTGGVGSVALILGLPFKVGGGGIGSFYESDAANNNAYGGTALQNSGPSNQVIFRVTATGSNGSIVNASVTQNASTTFNVFVSQNVSNV